MSCILCEPYKDCWLIKITTILCEKSLHESYTWNEVFAQTSDNPVFTDEKDMKNQALEKSSNSWQTGHTMPACN